MNLKPGCLVKVKKYSYWSDGPECCWTPAIITAQFINTGKNVKIYKDDILMFVDCKPKDKDLGMFFTQNTLILLSTILPSSIYDVIETVPNLEKND